MGDSNHFGYELRALAAAYCEEFKEINANNTDTDMEYIERVKRSPQSEIDKVLGDYQDAHIDGRNNLADAADRMMYDISDLLVQFGYHRRRVIVRNREEFNLFSEA